MTVSAFFEELSIWLMIVLMIITFILMIAV
jgi:hypothetical protein